MCDICSKFFMEVPQLISCSYASKTKRICFSIYASYICNKLEAKIYHHRQKWYNFTTAQFSPWLDGLKMPHEMPAISSNVSVYLNTFLFFLYIYFRDGSSSSFEFYIYLEFEIGLIYSIFIWASSIISYQGIKHTQILAWLGVTLHTILVGNIFTVQHVFHF